MSGSAAVRLSCQIVIRWRFGVVREPREPESRVARGSVERGNAAHQGSASRIPPPSVTPCRYGRNLARCGSPRPRILSEVHRVHLADASPRPIGAGPIGSCVNPGFGGLRGPTGRTRSGPNPMNPPVGGLHAHLSGCRRPVRHRRPARARSAVSSSRLLGGPAFPAGLAVGPFDSAHRDLRPTAPTRPDRPAGLPELV